MGQSSDGTSSVSGSQDKTHVLDYLANFIENSLDAIVASDSQDRIVFWNLAAERTFGWNASEAIGRSATELFWPTNIAQDQEERGQNELRLQRGEVVKGEQVIRCKDGSSLWVAYTVRTVTDNVSANGIAGYVAVYRDISERKRAEEQLERSNQKLNQILDSIQDDFYVLNRDWVFVYANRQFTSRIGKEPKDLVGNNIWVMFPKHVGGVLYENFHAVMGEREIRRFEIPGRYTDAWYRTTAFPSDEGITVLGTDITDLIRAEEQLRYQATLLKNVNDAIIASDAEFRITAWNSAAESMYGWKAEEILGSSGLEVIDTEWPGKDATEVRRTIGEIGHWRGEATQVRKDGSRFPVEVSSMVLYDDQGQITGYVSVTRDITERKKAEETLRESEERYRHLVKHAPAGIYEMDLKTMRFIEVNNVMCEILGYTREELFSMMPEELLDEEGRGRFRKRMRQTLAGEKVSEQAEYRVRAKEGREIWVVLTTTISYEKGKARSVSVIAHDITERKRMEREIESLARFPMENPNPVLRIQHDGIIAFANAASSNLLRLWNRAVGEHLPETEYKLLLQVLESRTAIEQEIDCARRIYSLIFTPIAEGGYVNIYGRDITERVQAEGALRRAQMDLERAQEVGQIGSWRLDVRQNILTWSDENHRIFGVPVGTPMSYETFLRIVHPNDRQYVDAQWDASLAGAPYDIEHRIIVDGRVKWVREKAYLEFDDAGDLLGGFGITQDITERKQAEINLSASKEQLRLLNETLEQKVNNQTAEVRRLTASLTKAEQRERSRIAHILHDDLQQRLYAVKMRLAFLTDGNMVDAAMEKEVSELDKQLAEILLLTRHLTIELSPPVLRDEGLRQAIEWLAFQMDEKLGMRVEVQAEESFATEDETVQVLLFNCVRELLFNIVKHAGVNRAVVSLQRSGDHLQIKVQDDGKGFDVATLFGKSKNDRGDTEEGKESFGLPTLRHQLSLLGGQMEIQSEPGAGTRITITIPNS